MAKKNTHSPKFEKYRDYYKKGLITSENLLKLVEKGVITEAEYREITETN